MTSGQTPLLYANAYGQRGTVGGGWAGWGWGVGVGWGTAQTIIIISALNGRLAS